MMNLRQSEHVVAWCAQECEWQGSGEMSVAHMFSAYLYARRHRTRPILLRDVLALGRIVEPRLNMVGLRTVGVRVGFDVKMDWQLVPAALDQLIAEQPAIPASVENATEWFRQYQEIHPWRDGNGRTGNILYNWLLGTLEAPVFPPNLWHDPRR